jgi:NAD(P)H-dependent FMN reductase
MLTIVSGTNRPNSLTSRFSKAYFELLKQRGKEVQMLDLSNLPSEALSTDIYDKGNKPESIVALQNQFFTNTSKFVFIFPEYNGSIPGILKLLIDVLDPKVAFGGKKAGMIGIATGRQGNLRGMDHLTGMLHHMNVTVMPFLLPVSKAHLEIDSTDVIAEATLKVLNLHVERMINF